MAIIGCTAYDDSKTKKKCKDIGMDGLMLKPIEKNDLKILLKIMQLI